MTDLNIGVGIQVEDIDWGKIDASEISDSLTKKIQPIAKDIHEILSEPVDMTQATKAVNNTFLALQRAYQSAESAQLNFNNMLEQAGKSSKTYKSQVKGIVSEIEKWQQYWNNMDDTYRGNTNFSSALDKTAQGISYDDLTNDEQSAWDKYIDAYKSGYNEIQTYISKLQNSMPDPTDFLGEISDSWQEKLANAYKKIGVAVSGAESALRKYNSAEQEQTEAYKKPTILERLSKAYEKLGTTLNKLAKVGKVAGKVLKTAFNGIRSAIRGTVKLFKSFKKAGEKSMDAVGKSGKRAWKNIMLFGLGFRSLYYLVKKLRSTITDQLKSMATQIPEVNTQISSFMTSLNQLKGDLGTAFQPIAAYVIPILNQLMGVLGNVLQSVGKFFAVLTGQNKIYTYTAATQDYAASLSDTADAAEEANRQLMGFDEINKLTADSSSNASDATEGTWNTEGTPVTSDLAELIKEGWANSDFSYVGQYLGEKLGEALDMAQEFLDTKVRDFAMRLSNSLATGINGFFNVIDTATKLGTVLGTAVQIAIESIHNFLSTINFAQIGAWFAEVFNNAIHSVNWVMLGETISQYFKNIFTGLNWLLSNIDLDGLSAAFYNVIDNIDIDGILEKMNEFIGHLADLLETIDWTHLGYKIGEFISGIDWATVLTTVVDVIYKTLLGLIKGTDWEKLGGDLLEGLGNGIKKAFGLLGDIVDAIFEILVGGIKRIFGIASPSKVMEEQGEYIGEGLANGIKTKIDGISELLAPLKEKILEVTRNIKENLSDAWNNTKEKVGNTFNTVKEKWSGIKSTVSEKMSGVAETVREKWNSAKESVATTSSGITDKVTEVCNNTKEEWDTVWSGITTKVDEFATNLSTKLTSLTSEITTWKSTFDKALSSVSTSFTKVWKSISTNLTSSLKTIIVNIENSMSKLVSTVSGYLTKLRTEWTNVFNEIKSFAQEGFNAVTETVSTDMEKILSTVKSCWTTIISTWSNKLEQIFSQTQSIFAKIASTVAGYCRNISSYCSSIKSYASNMATSVESSARRAANALSRLRSTSSKVNGYSTKGTVTTTITSVKWLASGGVIPPNNEFLAVLGDQKHGTNVEAPLSTIQEAVAGVVNGEGIIDAVYAMANEVVAAINSKDTDIKLDGMSLARKMYNYNKKVTNEHGSSLVYT